MNSYIVHKPRVRLERKSKSGAGIGLHEAVAAAEALTECLRADALARIAEITAGLNELREALAAGLVGSASAKVRLLADELAGLCGPFGLTELGTVASNLCRLVDVDDPCRTRLAAVQINLDIVQVLATTDRSAHAELARNVFPEIERLTKSLSHETSES